MDEKLLETVADIALAFGYDRLEDCDYDSRELVWEIVEWAKEFEAKYEGAAWNEEIDYIETIDNFANEKLTEWKQEHRYDYEEN